MLKSLNECMFLIFRTMTTGPSRYLRGADHSCVEHIELGALTPELLLMVDKIHSMARAIFQVQNILLDAI
jgi:hypothetical protein